MTTARVLTVSDAVTLADIIRAAQGCQRVRWQNEHGDIMEGTARSIGDDRGNFAGPADDVRDCYLRVTTVQGWECFLPVSEVAELSRAGLFGVDG